MQLKQLEIDNFKNIGEARLELSPNVNCFVGNNGMGKSNLLDAVHYLSLCRSFSGLTDAQLLRRPPAGEAGEGWFALRGLFGRLGADEQVSIGVEPGRRKVLKRAGKECRRLSDHIGLYPIVMASPADTDLIRGTGEERRRWLDMVLSQGDPAYLDALVRYTDALRQRNRLLRDHAVDHGLYQAVEAVMAMAADTVVKRRAALLERLTALFGRYWQAIGLSDENPSLSYEPSAGITSGEAFEAALQSARSHDEAVGHTSVGPHRDDIAMTIGPGLPMRRAGSQGQCKTFTIALRLAQFEFVKQATGLTPLLLLDDIFDKLDAGRVERIVELVAGDRFGQIFITDTNRGHLDNILGALQPADRRLWNVDHGSLTRTL